MSTARSRLGSVALVAAAVFFVIYPASRPWEDETTVEGATTAMDSTAWVMSHLFGMIGLILLPVGLLGVRYAVSGTRAEPVAFAALLTGWLGVGFSLPFFGAETFGLNAIASAAADGQQFDLLDLVDSVRYGAVAVTTFAAGMIAVGIAAVVAAVAVWRSRVLPRYSGVVFAFAFALYAPQFFTPPAARIAHGVLVAIGCLWLAVALWRRRADGPRTGRRPSSADHPEP